MGKTKLEIRGMSCQHCVKTVTAALTSLEGVQRVKVNLRKGEAIIRFDTSRLTANNFAAAIAEVGFETVTKKTPLSLRLTGSILIALLTITGCSEMHYTGSMLTPEDVKKYITIGEDSACLMSGDESVCITLIPETDDDSRPIIHIHQRKIIYVFYYEGVPIMRAERVMDTTGIMEQVRGPGEDDQPPKDDGSGTPGDGGTQQLDDDDTPPDDGEDDIYYGEDNVDGTPGDDDGGTPDDGGIQQPGGGTQKPDGGTQQPDGGSTPRFDDNNGGTQQPPPPPPPPSSGGNQNGDGNNGQGNNGNGNNGQGNNGQGNNGNGNNGQGNNGNNGQGNNGQGNNGQGNNGNNGQGNNGQGNNGDQNGDQNGENNQNSNQNGGNNQRDRNTVVGASDLSTHYYYTNKDPIEGNGWLVHVYYPANYNGPRGLREDPQGYGFTVGLSGTEAKITQFAQTAGPCRDDNKPCNTVIEPNNPSTYSVQMYIETQETSISISVNWKSPYSHLTKTYTLNAAVNIAENTSNHTSQEDD